MSRPHAITVQNQPARRAFTLVELMVVIMIIAILSSLTLAGLSGVRQRAREDKTKSTIRKIDAVIRPMYDSYRTRRVMVSQNIDPRLAAVQKLAGLRRLMIYEMPDSWADVPTLEEFLDTDPTSEFGSNSSLKSATVRRYALAKRLASPTPLYGSAECLHMILNVGGFEPDALEFFRPDEIGDIDGDGMPEFWDGWNRPIHFLRWAPGFSKPLSLVQDSDPAKFHDPFDPWGCDPNGFALVPLVYSAGPDEAGNDPLAGSERGVDFGYGLTRVSDQPWHEKSLGNVSDLVYVGAPETFDSTAHRDNITNHDLSSQ